MSSAGGFGYGYVRGWSTDYPKADRQFLLAMKRLTRIQGRSTEQVVDLGGDDIFNYPWIYAVQVQTWTFNDAEAAKLREYLLKGGFLMVDDFHGTEDWETFLEGMRIVLPDRPIEDLENRDEIFHTLYDLDDRFQVPGEQYVETGRTYEKDGYVAKWRAIRARQRARLSSPFATTCIWATPGSGRTSQNIQSALPPWLFGLDWTTSFTE